MRTFLLGLTVGLGLAGTLALADDLYDRQGNVRAPAECAAIRLFPKPATADRRRRDAPADGAGPTQPSCEAVPMSHLPEDEESGLESRELVEFKALVVQYRQRFGTEPDSWVLGPSDNRARDIRDAIRSGKPIVLNIPPGCDA